jgi:hypothetical protein
MEKFKIELFEREHKIEFPHFVSQSAEECLRIVNRLSAKYKLSQIDILIDQLYSNKELLLSMNACNGFRLIETLRSLNLSSLTNVYVNWYRFDNIDKFRTDDLNKYFDDIWFPSSDDIDIFDESLDWIISIRHDGCVSLIKR